MARHPSRTASAIVLFWRGRDVAVAYAAIVVVATVTVALLPGQLTQAAVLGSSTNLANLRDSAPHVLLLSAFVQASPAELVIVPVLVWAFGALQRWLGRGVTILTGVLGHVGASLLVAGALVAGIRYGHVDVSVAQAVDVGASYAMAAVAGLLAARIHRRWAVAYVSVVTAVLGVALVANRTFTDLGHVVAWLIGLALAVVASGLARRALPSAVAPPHRRPASAPDSTSPST